MARITAGGTGLPTGALGVGQFSNTILTVYGCSRQGTQVTCNADISNQTKGETQLQSSVAWNDAFIIDDRGDRHKRAFAFFLNIDGEQRVDLDVPYGQSVRYIFVFNDVSAKVSKVSLHSAAGGLDVENIPVTDPGALPAAASPADSAGNARPGGNTGARVPRP
jgi:hypothetical protein